MKNVNRILQISLAILLSSCNSSMYNKPSANASGEEKSSSVSGDYYFKIQEYERSIKNYNRQLEGKSNDAAVLHAARLQLARVYYETRQFEKSASLYGEVISDGIMDRLTPRDIDNYLDLLRRSGQLSKANEVHNRFIGLMNDTRYQNIGKSLKKYSGFLGQRYDSLGTYGLEDLGDKAEMVKLNATGYQYGVSPFKEGIIFLANYVQENRAKSLYVNSRMYYKDQKGLTSFDKGLQYFIQSGPAVFFNDNKSIIYTTNRYNNVHNEKQLNTLVVNGLQLVSATYNNNTGKWSKPKRISAWAGKRSAQYSFMHPSLSADGKRLYFASDMPGGYGGSDIYFSDWDQKNKKWGNAVNLGPEINTNGNELFPQLISGNRLLFSSNGQEGYGGQDIYIVSLEAKADVIHLPYPVNTQYDDVNPVYQAAEHIFYFASDRPGYNLRDRVYMLDMTKSPLTELGYAPLEKKKEQVVVDVRTVTDELSDGQVKKVKPSYLMHFDFDKSALKNDDIVYLQDILNNYNSSQYMVRIDGYADGIGDLNYNLALSRRRAENVKNYLVEGGMSPTQILSNGYGSSKLKVTCEDYINRDECIKIQSLNRRCEIAIYEKEQ